MSFQLQPVSQTSASQLGDFLIRQFGQTKGQFLIQHGDWWHQGQQNRFVVWDNNSHVLAAYYAITPMYALIDGQPHPSLWWIDLMVDRAFRRQGLQTLMDDAVRNRPGLKFGFPNRFHAGILQKHGWSIRNDLRKYLLPLQPHRVRSIQTASGKRGIILRSAAQLLRPLFATLRHHWANYRPLTARLMDNPSPEQLAEIALSHTSTQMITTYRQPIFWQWRYFAAPYANELKFYIAGTPPNLYAITRLAQLRGTKTLRILDLYGDLTASTQLTDLLKQIIRDAIYQKADQLTILAPVQTLPHLQKILTSQLFWITVPVHFCWHTSDPILHQKITHTAGYWTLADSDNDEPH